jgi:hypothetical protein
VEQVKLKTLPWVEETGQGPIDELLEVIDELRSDPGELEKAGRWLDDLRNKLPDEFRALPDAPRLDDPAWLAAALREVEALLRDHLCPTFPR